MEKFKNLPENKKKELIEKAYQLAYEYEQKYGNCPQCVMAAIGDVFGCVEDMVFKAGYTLAGGFASSVQGTCGALSGAGMIISSLHGRDRESFAKGKFPKGRELTRKVYERFVEEYGGCLCYQVHEKIFNGRSFNLSVEKEYQEFLEAGGHVDKCPSVVGNVAKWLAEMLVEGEL